MKTCFDCFSMAFVMEELEVKNIVNLACKIITPFKIGDIVKDLKTNRIATVIKCYKGSNRPYYFIVFNNNTGCYRNMYF